MSNEQSSTFANAPANDKSTISSGFLSARIVGQLGPRTFLVQPGGSDKTHCAELATFEDHILAKGERVVVQPDQHGQYFITGRIGPGKQSDIRPGKELFTPCGASATLADRDNGKTLQVSDCNGQVIFEYDPAAGGGRMALEAESLALNARQHIDICAGTNLRIFSGHDTEIQALASVNMVSLPENGARFHLTPESIRIKSGSLDCISRKTRVRFESGHVQGKKLTTHFSFLRTTVDRLETIASRLIERVDNAYRKISGLDQKHAGRTRTICEDSHTVKANRVRLDGHDVVKVQSDKIHLG